MKLDELISVVKKFDILFKDMSKQRLSGSFNSLFKGRGLNFDAIRHYQDGDDVRNINWNVTARLRATHTNTYTEDKERLIWIMIDVSPSANFGTIGRSKLDLELEIAISLAYSALKMNDTVGMVFFSDRIEKLIQPAKGMPNFWYIAKTMTEIRPAGRSTDIGAALEFLMKISGHNSMIILLSDFMCGGYGPVSKIIAQKHDLLALRVFDKREYELPPLGWIKLKDIDNDHRKWVNTSSTRFIAEHQGQYKAHEAYFDSVYGKHYLKNAAFATHEDAAMKLINLMEGRHA
jgi:uncharacterized protein (DUF58 family)